MTVFLHFAQTSSPRNWQKFPEAVLGQGWEGSGQLQAAPEGSVRAEGAGFPRLVLYEVPAENCLLSLSPIYSSKLLGVCSLPGCTFKDVRRNLQQDIGESSDQCRSASHFHGRDELKNYGTWDRFVLCTRGKLLKYRVPNLIDAYQQHGICVHGDTPDIAECCRILEELRSWVSAVRCYSGLGHLCLRK
nr:cyclin-dependent kinase inhibitor 3 [Anas platyrhynchos]